MATTKATKARTTDQLRTSRHAAHTASTLMTAGVTR